MTIHFASARDTSATPFAKVLIQRRQLSAANDNARISARDPLMAEALRHFAQYGLAAAAEARLKAEAAFFAGDRPAYDRWLGICRILDRRLARHVSLNVESM